MEIKKWISTESFMANVVFAGGRNIKQTDALHWLAKQLDEEYSYKLVIRSFPSKKLIYLMAFNAIGESQSAEAMDRLAHNFLLIRAAHRKSISNLFNSKKG